jgi:hypothetical protein
VQQVNSIGDEGGVSYTLASARLASGGGEDGCEGGLYPGSIDHHAGGWVIPRAVGPCRHDRPQALGIGNDRSKVGDHLEVAPDTDLEVVVVDQEDDTTVLGIHAVPHHSNGANPKGPSLGQL